MLSVPRTKTSIRLGPHETRLRARRGRPRRGLSTRRGSSSGPRRSWCKPHPSRRSPTRDLVNAPVGPCGENRDLVVRLADDDGRGARDERAAEVFEACAVPGRRAAPRGRGALRLLMQEVAGHRIANEELEQAVGGHHGRAVRERVPLVAERGPGSPRDVVERVPEVSVRPGGRGHELRRVRGGDCRVRDEASVERGPTPSIHGSGARSRPCPSS